MGRDLILVTGATGFLGHNLVSFLVSSGYPVRALVRHLTAGPPPPPPPAGGGRAGAAPGRGASSVSGATRRRLSARTCTARPTSWKPPKRLRVAPETEEARA